MTQKQVWLAGATVLLVLLFGADAQAQCVMCKAVAEDSAAQGAVGRGINQGILYIMAVPYILLGSIAYLIFKKWKFVE